MGWSDRIFATLRTWCMHIFLWVTNNVPVLRMFRLGEKVGFLTPDEDKRAVPVLDALYDIPNLPDDVRQTLDFMKWMIAKTEIPLDTLIAMMGVNSVLSGYLSPVAVNAAFHTSRKLATARPAPAVAWLMAFRAPELTPLLRDMLKDIGWTDTLIDAFRDVARQYPSVGENMTLLWRGEINDSGFLSRLAKLGYLAAESTEMLTLAKRIPGPGDLIGMAVREAFHPDLISKYHYMDAFPPEFAEWMEKQGYDRHWAEKYWVAHWRLPSIQSGFEMLHRGQIGMTEIRDLLRTADIAPIWHDPLVAIAYQPYTRVDVRRMHKLGVLTDADLVKSYKDLGYDQEHAENMALFTILYNAGADREGTKADILKGYRSGAFRADATKLMLIDLGYTEYWADYYLSIEDLREATELAEEELATIKALYIGREIAESDARSRLAALDLTSARGEKLLKVWGIQRKRTITRASVSKLESFFRDDLITSAAFRRELIRKGYTEDWAVVYVQSLLAEMQRAAVAEEERAGKEQERVAAAAEKTAYQIDKARIDAQIAQEKVRQLNIRVYMQQLMSSEERRGLMDVLETSKVRIAEIQADIARKRTRLQEARGALRVLEISPTLQSLYDRRDEARIQITEIAATIADLQSLLVDARIALQRATVSGEVETLRRGIDSLTLEIAGYREIRAQLRLQIAETDSEIARATAQREMERVALDQLDLAPAIRDLYDLKDTTTLQVADLRADVAELQGAITTTDALIRSETVSPEVLGQRESIDVILVDILQEQEEIAEIKLAVAQAQARLVGELTGEEVAILEEQLRQSQLAIRELEAERARLRLEYVE